MSAQHDDRLSIGQLARRAGVSAQAIRYYERIGLLPAPARGANGYRWYRPADVKRVQLLHRMRALGTPLAAAKPLVDRADQALCAEVQHDLLALTHTRLAEIDHEIAALVALRAEVKRFQRALEAVCLCHETSFAACDDACVTQPESCLSEEDQMQIYANDNCCDCCDDPNCDCSTCGCGCCV
jgi:DNA-binding transcriptional MerR regulator